jgi:hypothetical protein
VAERASAFCLASDGLPAYSPGAKIGIFAAFAGHNRNAWRAVESHQTVRQQPHRCKFVHLRCQACDRWIRCPDGRRRYCSVRCRRYKGLCAAENCTGEARIGGVCWRHYGEHRKLVRKLLGLNSRMRPLIWFRGVCPECDTAWRSLDPKKRYCSRRCQRRACDRARTGGRPKRILAWPTGDREMPLARWQAHIVDCEKNLVIASDDADGLANDRKD